MALDIKDGTYDCVVLDGTLGSADLGARGVVPKITVRAEVTFVDASGVTKKATMKKDFFAGNDPSPFDEHRDEHGNPKPEWRVTAEKLADIGLSFEDFCASPPRFDAIKNYRGKCGVKTKGTYTDISWIGPDKGAKAPPPMETNAQMSFAATMRANLQAAGMLGPNAAKGGKPAAQISRKPAGVQQRDAEAGEDEIPF